MQTFWEQEFKCPVCSKKFHTLRLFSNAIKIRDRDSDMKPTYDGVNALLFQLVTCPECFYTTFEGDFENPVPPEKQKMVSELCERLKKMISVDLSENRTLKDGASLFTVAAAIYALLGKHLKAAEAYLKLAWLLRDLNNSEEEKKALSGALKHFTESYMNEELSEQQQIMVIFYLGELNARLSNKSEAIKWFSTLIQKFSSSNSAYVKLARKEWQEISARK
ncbi:DUF2225 domain-containing protein [Pseudothermotoga sp. U03pept]|uniref:DUF2225 domain-containing protein n=1 Tax=Pseudothermotoga sp. U03pept TaxID=3447012 RepID=UPI003F11C148